jgi:hypothetical protein
MDLTLSFLPEDEGRSILQNVSIFKTF